MSYDIRFGVKVEGADNVYAVIGEPELSSPTYNNRKIFETCMDWDYEQGKWYPLEFVEKKVHEGINELVSNPHLYRHLEPDNGWGGIESSLNALKSIEEWINDEYRWGWNVDVPKKCVYMKW